MSHTLGGFCLQSSNYSADRCVRVCSWANRMMMSLPGDLLSSVEWWDNYWVNLQGTWKEEVVI